MRVLIFFIAILETLSLTPAKAASLRVAPVLIDLTAPTAASSLRIWNDAKQPVDVQVRIYRWRQTGGVDAYTPATDVMVSPPMSRLRPGGENMVRVVRTSKKPVSGEESYRLIVDELPDNGTQRSGTVSLVVRHSIPVFFSQPGIAPESTTWSVVRRANGYQVTVSNKGDKRLRVSDLSLEAANGPVASEKGLVGYILGQSSMSWLVPGKHNVQAGGSLKISAQSEAGRLDEQVRVRSN
ncbi:fimbrial biogenesis chaperone [Brucella pituitosa]|uniref:fimbrial biogenesis chaperone n=1 Tax=Brucella pituitosa TaxID=571256 RepID=UPI0009A1FD5B|nr:molecular chaperone [Brucella pituitosa]